MLRHHRRRLIRSAIVCEVMADVGVAVVFVGLLPHVAVALWPLVIYAAQKRAESHAVLLD